MGLTYYYIYIVAVWNGSLLISHDNIIVIVVFVITIILYLAKHLTMNYDTFT